jgi:hypothetical protein
MLSKPKPLGKRVCGGGAISVSLQFHPLADIFPLMEGAEFNELVADIKANGLCECIVLYDGMILDGRNRYRACLKAGFEPVTIDGGKLIKNPAAYVISANIHRRHLTAEQKRELIAKLIKGNAREVRSADRRDREGEPSHRRGRAHQDGGTWASCPRLDPDRQQRPQAAGEEVQKSY